MRCMVLESPAPARERPLQSREVADPVPAAGEVLLDVKACGVCRTDLQIAEGDLAAKKIPIVPGHQVVGRIAAVGTGVDPRRVGERVGVAWLASACGNCRDCARGRENLCANARFTGWE